MQGRYKSKRAEVLALILQGSTPKAAAIQAGAHGCYGNKVTAWHGLQPLYVSAVEREAVLTGRSRLTRQTTVRAVRSPQNRQ